MNDIPQGQSKIGKLIAPKQDDTPAGLANELVAAQQQYQATRNDVLDRAVARSAHLASLQQEIEEERDALDGVVERARQ